jgi:hypothetical protein
VLLDDVLGSPEPLEGLGAQCVRTRRRSSFPDALHDELEVGRLDALLRIRALDRSEPTESGLDLAGSHLVEHALDELRLDGDGDAVSSR